MMYVLVWMQRPGSEALAAIGEHANVRRLDQGYSRTLLQNKMCSYAHRQFLATWGFWSLMRLIPQLLIPIVITPFRVVSPTCAHSDSLLSLTVTRATLSE